MKVSLLHKETSEMEKSDFVGCYAIWLTDWHRNINIYPNIDSCVNSLRFRGNSTIRFNCKPKGQKIYGILEKLF